MRIPLGVSIESRDGTVQRGARVVNAFVEQKGEGDVRIRKRPGVGDVGTVHSGTAQLLYPWFGLNAIIGDSLYRGTPSTILGSSGTALTPTNAGLRFDAQETGASAATQRLMIKNRSQAWTVTNTGTVSAVSFASSMGAQTYNVVSITRSSTTATVTLPTSDSPFNVGDSVIIAGAGQAAYNGTQTVTAVTPGIFTAAVDIAITVTELNGTATATTVSGAHGLTNGVAYTISGADQTEYNGSYTVTVLNSTQFTFPVTETPATPATGSPTVSSWQDRSCGTVTSTGSTAHISTPNGNTFFNGESISIQFGLSSSVWVAGSYTVANRTSSGFDVTLSGTPSPSSNLVNQAIRTGAPSISSITRSGTTATVTFSSAHNFEQSSSSGSTGGTLLTITGATQSGYNVIIRSVTITSSTTVTFTVTVSPATPGTGPIVVTKPGVTTNTTFTYTVAGSPTTPATGTITAQGNGGMVPGIAYIAGYFFVMDNNGVMWHSAIDDPTSWPALNNLTAQAENGGGKALAKSGDYLIALKEWSTEFFFNAKNTVGFAFSPVENGFTQVGCAAGESVAKIDGNLIFVSQVRERGRSVHLMSGLQQEKVSTPDVERILNADDLATVYAYGLKFGGHSVYVLTLKTSGITLVYDLSTQTWTQWTSLTVGSSATTCTAVSNGDTATITQPRPGFITLAPGDVVKVAGLGLGGSVTVYAVVLGIGGGNPLTGPTFDVAFVGLVVGSGITVTQYSESYFQYVKAMDYGSSLYLLHESDGHLTQISSTNKTDTVGGVTTPIRESARTIRLDGGTTAPKVMGVARMVGDSSSDFAYLRWSDDDESTWTNPAFVDLSQDPPEVRRQGKFRRRTGELTYVGTNNPEFAALELEIS